MTTAEDIQKHIPPFETVNWLARRLQRQEQHNKNFPEKTL